MSSGLLERKIMNLVKAYFKLLLIRNRANYLFVALSTIICYLVVSITMIYIDNILILSSDSIYSNMHYIYIGIRTVIFLAGVTFIIHQYYNILKSGARDYGIFKGLGATNRDLINLLFIQVILLIVISILVGMLGGYFLTGLITRFISEYSLNHKVMEGVASSTAFFIASGSSCLIITIIGAFLWNGIKKQPVSDLFSDSHILSEEGFTYGGY